MHAFMLQNSPTSIGNVLYMLSLSFLQVCWLWKKALWKEPDQKVVDTRLSKGSEIMIMQHMFGDGRVSPGGMGKDFKMIVCFYG